MKWLIPIAILIAAIIAAPFVFDGETIEITEQVRTSSPHQFAELPKGKTEYSLEGHNLSGTAVLVHGASGPMETWKNTSDFLIANGFKVLRYNMWGRGLSDRPDIAYNLDDYVQQLKNLLDDLVIKSPIDIYGHSFGCIVASEFAQRFPKRIRKITLVSPAGFPVEGNPMKALLDVPNIGEYMLSVLGDKLLVSHNKKYFSNPVRHKNLIEAYQNQMQFIGFKSAQLQTIRNAPLQTYGNRFLGVTKLQKPLFVAWGEKDQTFPIEHSAIFYRAKQRPPFIWRAKDSAHLPHVEEQELFEKHLFNWLTRNVRVHSAKPSPFDDLDGKSVQKLGCMSQTPTGPILNEQTPHFRKIKHQQGKVSFKSRYKMAGSNLEVIISRGGCAHYGYNYEFILPRDQVPDDEADQYLLAVDLANALPHKKGETHALKEITNRVATATKDPATLKLGFLSDADGYSTVFFHSETKKGKIHITIGESISL